MQINSVEVPCYGTLEEILEVLKTAFKLENGTDVLINGSGYEITEKGFRSLWSSSKEYDVTDPAFLEMICPGIAILLGRYGDDDEGPFDIITTGKLPHVSKRCPYCGEQLTADQVERGAHPSCFEAEL